MSPTETALSAQIVKIEYSLARIAQALEAIAKKQDTAFKTHGEILAAKNKPPHLR
jgi:uncharacterized coiled-coil protein SlyX